MNIVIIIATFLCMSQTHAGGNSLDKTKKGSSDDSLKTDDIMIGDFDGPSERLRVRREKLEEKNKIMVDKKNEDIRVKKEIALTNKLQDAFKKNTDPKNSNKENSSLITKTKKEDSIDEIASELLANSKNSTFSLSDEERIDSTKTNINSLIYNITLLKIFNNEAKIEGSKIESSSSTLKDKYCNHPSYKRLREAYFNVTTSYRATNGELLYEVTSTPSDCQEIQK